MNWDELYRQGIDVESISRDSEEYQTMFSAAVNGNPSAQYCLGLWAEKVHKKTAVALIWLKKAAKQHFEGATEAFQRLESEQSLIIENIAEAQPFEEGSESVRGGINNQPTSLVINEHNFQEAKNSLQKYMGQAKKDVELSRVPNDEGLFKLRKHKVTGSELNRITSQIQDYLRNLNTLGQGLVDEFGQVYQAFEYLDKDYISGIVASIKAAEEVSKQEQKDRKDIKELVAQHELSVAVLKKFKADIDQLKHLTDIDKAWDLIEKQTKLSKEFSEYLAGLSKVKHLKDVDELYTDFEKLQKDFSALCVKHSQYADELKTVREYCDTLSKLKHISDIDKLWNIAETSTTEIHNIKTTLEDYMRTIGAFHGVIQQMQESQQEFVNKINQAISEFREGVNKQIMAFTEAQDIKLSDIDRHYFEEIENLSIEQKAKQESIEKELKNLLDSAVQEQVSAISKIENTQKEKFEELLKDQSSTLEQIANDQSSKLEQIYQSIEEEKNILNEKVNALTHKVKLLYIVAGSAAALTVIQLLLNILGVF